MSARSSSLTPIEEDLDDDASPTEHSSSDSPLTSPSRPPRNHGSTLSAFESQLMSILPTKPSLERTVVCSSTRALSVEPTVPSSDPGVAVSSPIVGSRAVRIQKTRKKGRKKWAATMADQKLEKETMVAELRRKRLIETLDDLHKRGLGFGDLFDFVFDPGEYQGNIRYQEFYRKEGWVTKALSQWMSNETARREVHNWAVEYVESVVRKEAKGITTNGHLRQPLSPEMLTSFSFFGLRKKLDDWAPTTMRLFSAFSTSARQLRDGLSSARIARKNLVQVIAATSCLGEYSRLNTFTKNINSLFLYARGAQRQITAVLSHFGLCSSYPTLVQKGNPLPKQPTLTQADRDPPLPSKTTAPLPIETPGSDSSDSEGFDDTSSSSSYYPSSSEDSDVDYVRAPKVMKNGILPSLAEQLRQRVRKVIATGLFGGVFDNINFMSKVGEQIVGRTGTTHQLL
ncbi:hypothetical protein PM082_009785 [Marasmius tenuissimus]|nr:hypothetical protein PM082_009785 [Marasmius tenuissimus]